MKRNIYLLALMMIFATLVNGQVTIESTELTLPISPDTTTFLFVTDELPIPAEGEDQIWDYSTLPGSGYIELSQSYKIPSDPNFPDADAYDTYSVTLGAITTSNNREFFTETPEVIYRSGTHIEDTTFNIGVLTGNQADNLELLENVNHFREVYYEFPMQYKSSWNTDDRIVTKLLITIAAYGFIDDSVFVVQHVNRHDTIVGWGQLTLPGGKGPYNALLIKSQRTSTDSFYLGNFPAPQALLAAFGLTQGGATSEYQYKLMVEGTQFPAITFATDPTFSTVLSSFISTSIHDPVSTASPDISSVEVIAYPNPIKENHTLYLKFGKPLMRPQLLQLWDAQGRLILEKEVLNHRGEASIYINKHLNGQFLFFTLKSEQKVTSFGKIMISK